MLNKRNLIFLCLLILGVLLLSSCFLKPPVTEGILKGQVIVPEGTVQVKDLTGQALPNATVNIIDPVTGDIIATATTDDNGHYQVFVPAGGPYLLQAIKDGVKVLQITPQVEIGIEYELGTADCSTTAVALIVQAILDAEDYPNNLADINLTDIAADPNFNDVMSIVCSTIEAGEDPALSAVVQQAVEDFLYPPASIPTPAPTPLTAIGAITGTAKVGETLTAGALTPSGATADYQWQICATSGGTYANISGATTTTYTPVADDVTKFIKVAATGTGNYSGTVTSAATDTVEKVDGPAAPAPPVLDTKTATSITLEANALHQFNKDDGAWQDSEVFTGLTPVTQYTFRARVKETATHKASAASTGTAITTSAAVMGGTVAITGDAKYNELLTADISGITYTPSTTDDVPTYQWKRGGTNIGGATNSTYTLVEADIGTVITVTVTADGVHATGSVTSAATDTVEKADGPAALAPPVLDTKTATSITLEANALHQFNKYDGAWQDSEVFTGLTPVTQYTFRARVKETATHKASAASTGTAITTSPLTYTVTFDSQGGSAVDPQTVEHGGLATKPPDPRRTGRIFGGWYKETGCTTPWNFDTDTVTDNVTLYAQWTYTVTFNSKGGSAVDLQTVEHGGLATEPPDPTWTGYTFSGWYKETGCTTHWNFANDTVTSNVTLYAKWTPLYALRDIGPAGGLIFYVKEGGYSEGWMYLEAALSDQHYMGDYTVEWGCRGTLIPGADGILVGTGKQNTIDIEAGCTTAGTAADICANLILGGESDWFLPSRYELDLMYINLHTAAGGAVGYFADYPYWSSSELDDDLAWFQYFHDGDQGYRLKDNDFRVRAVRAF